MPTCGALRAVRLVRAAGRNHPRWTASAALLCAATGWWLTGPGTSGGGAVLGRLAAGGWGLGLLPVHSDSRLTGPVRRMPAVLPPEPQPGPAGIPPDQGRNR